MNELELSKRKQRAETEPLVITKTTEGYRIFSAANPSKFYLVRALDGRIACNCLDFEKNSLDATWRCKHVLAVELNGANPKKELDEERDAIQEEANGDFLSLPDPAPHSRLLIKRSISPDGRIDSVSLEMDLELNGEPPAVIKAKAIDALRLEAEIASVFLTSHELQKETNKPESLHTNGLPHLPEPGTVEATLQNIGVMPGKWGPRHFINVDVQGRYAKLFGTPKQIATAIQAAGYNFSDSAVAEGISLNIPCRVVTKQNGQYLNIERVFPVR